ncbi:MAG: hypothetical protein QM734_05960 [Cyclobacteriaceae bacterium]
MNLSILKKVEKRFLDKGDSLSWALSDQLKVLKAEEKMNLSKPKLDSLAKKIIETEFVLHQEYHQYSYAHGFFESNDEGLSSAEHRTPQLLIAIGFILIVVLNGLYLIYFHRDSQ